jgi:hypothetical protein
VACHETTVGPRVKIFDIMWDLDMMRMGGGVGTYRGSEKLETLQGPWRKAIMQSERAVTDYH